jgi:hypothetical protein
MSSLWEILVPTEKRIKAHPMADAKANFYSTRFHKVWDAKVRAITGGLTIMAPSKGQWKSPEGELFLERMIPVRIVATREQIEEIIEITLLYYDQLAVLCYKLSDEVILKYAEESRNKPAKKLTESEVHLADLSEQRMNHVLEARALYAKWVDRMGIHSNRMPGWDELTDKEQDKWIKEAFHNDPNAFTISGGVKLYETDDIQ